MAVLNPLEKKARSSFIKGLLIAGFIGAIIIAFLGLWIFRKNGEEKQRLDAQKSVAVLQQDVKSGDPITSEMIKDVRVDPGIAITGALTEGEFDSLSIDEDGLEVNIIAKIDLPAKSILTLDMLTNEEETITNDLREQEYNMIVPYTNLSDGDIVDIRLRLPSGEDYIVLSKKRVTLIDLGGTYSTETMKFKLTETEILTMSGAIVDAYQINGSKLYAVKYSDPGMQSAAEATYVASGSTKNLINLDPNIVDTAREQLSRRLYRRILRLVPLWY